MKKNVSKLYLPPIVNYSHVKPNVTCCNSLIGFICVVYVINVEINYTKFEIYVKIDYPFLFYLYLTDIRCHHKAFATLCSYVIFVLFSYT